MRRRQILIFSILVLVMALIWIVPASAQEKTLYWDRLDVHVKVNQDGTFRVEENARIVFTHGLFHYGTRNIPMGRLTDITDITVSDPGRVYQNSGSGAPYTFQTAHSDGDLVIKWYYPAAENEARTFTIGYTVHGGLRYYDEGDQLWWKALFPDRPAPIRHSTVTVTLPKNVQVSKFTAYLYKGSGYQTGTTADIGQQIAPNVVQYALPKPLESGQTMEVEVAWPHGLIAGSPEPWQVSADQAEKAYAKKIALRQKWGPVLSLLLLALGILFSVGGALLAYITWFTKGRDAPTEVFADYLPEPPSDLPPGIVGTLVDEKADMEDILATVVDLARRGFLTIQEIDKEKSGKVTDFQYTLNDADFSKLRPYERKVLEAFFDSLEAGESQQLSDLKNRFYKEIPSIQEAIYQEAVEAGLFPKSPAKVRQSYTLLASLIFGVGIAVLFFLPGLFSALSDLGYCPGAGLILGSIPFFIIPSFMPRKTKKGAEAAKRWQAFERYLRNLKKYTDVKKGAEVFEHYLPYTIAFGLSRKWIKLFERVDAPMPVWYQPMPWYGYGQGSTWGSGKQHAGHASMAPAGGVESEGGARPSLSDMSSGLGGGLSAMSAGLGNMLSEASKTLTSKPASDSSGGFSSGGFGGGFSGGGGGGGGGSFG